MSIDLHNKIILISMHFLMRNLEFYENLLKKLILPKIYQINCFLILKKFKNFSKGNFERELYKFIF